MSIDGAWNLVIKSPMGDQRSTLTAKADGATLSGTMSGPAGQSEVENGKVDGGQVSWSAKITSPMPLTLEFAGAVSGDSLSGSVKLGAFGSAPFTGERA